MLAYPDNVYQQAVVVLDSTSGSPELLPPQEDVSGKYPFTIGSSLTGNPNVPLQQASLVLGTAFSNVPVILKSELMNEYQEVGLALSEMNELEEGDECKIKAPVYNTACFIASVLMAISVPPPRVFTHGPDSVVFNWANQADNLYLTISADRMSALISSPERIKRRIEWTTKELMDPSLALSSIKAAYLGEPVKVLISGLVPAAPTD